MYDNYENLAEECARLVIAAAVDNNCVCYNADGNGYTPRLEAIIACTLASWNKQDHHDKEENCECREGISKPNKVIHLNKAMNAYTEEILGYRRMANKKHHICIAFNDKPLPFYIIKYKNNYGLVILHSKNMVMAEY